MWSWSKYHSLLVRGNLFVSAAMNCTYHACKVLRTRLWLHACNIQIVPALRRDSALLHAFALDILERLAWNNEHADLTRVVFIDEDTFTVPHRQSVVTALAYGDRKSLVFCWGVVASVMLWQKIVIDKTVSEEQNVKALSSFNICKILRCLIWPHSEAVRIQTC